METTVLSIVCFTLSAVIIWLIARNPEAVRHMLGIAVIRDQDEMAIRNAVSAACKGLDVEKLNIDQAEDLIRETARHAIAQHFANVNPGRKYEVTRNWPDAKVVISGNIAVVRPILGHDYMNDHDGIRAVNFEINREHKVLHLRPWAPKQQEPPPIGVPLDGKLAAKRADPQKPQPLQSAKPRPEPSRKASR